MTVAVIDIGTNTVLLLVAAIDDGGSVTPLVYEQRVPRLGKGVDASRRLADDAIERVVSVVREYTALMHPHAPETIVVCGTSAVRDASNRTRLAERLEQETGLRLEIMSGSDEALWTYRGAISGLKAVARATVLDIGGGSTEVITGDRTGTTGHLSLDIGSVRLTERLLHHDPPLEREIREARELIRTALRETDTLPAAGTQLVAVAGTATALAILVQGLRTFSLDAVSGFGISRAQVRDLTLMLCIQRSENIRKLSDVLEGRADIITAGALILDEIMERHGFPDLIVSERGVRYGVAIREWERLQRGGVRT